ncbi:PfkB family carbohydrate kinase [Nocardia alni]|uniref:PfkB family carbohydrate kinase n=1 Tax=Nocardia alni TaxID=2815723 RepID=UPI001C23C5BB|nr:carbohydrate kinase family protein [Nocardia alni]
MTGDDTTVAAVRSVLTSLRKRAGLQPDRLHRTEIDADALIEQPVIQTYADNADLSPLEAALPVIRAMARNLTPTDRLVVDVELNLRLLENAPPPGVNTTDLYADDLGARRWYLCTYWSELHHGVPDEDIPDTPTLRTIRGSTEERAFTELARLIVEGSAYGAVLPAAVTEQPQSAPRVVVVGDAVIDHLYRVEQMPGAGASVWGTRVVHPGGKGLNRAVAIAEFGWPAALLAAVGDDDAGHNLRNYLRDKHVNTSLVKTVEQTPTPVTAVIVSRRTGEQAIIADKDERMTLSDNDIGSPAVHAAIAAADALLFTFEQPVRVLTGLLDVVRTLRHPPQLIVHASPTLPRPQSLYPYLPMIDYLIGSTTDLDALVSNTGSPVGDTAQRLRVAGVRGVCTLKGFGCTVHSDHGDFDIPPFPSMLTRSPGAPAAFTAALTHRLLDTPHPPGEIDFVWATAAMVATQSLDSVPESMPPTSRVDNIVQLRLAREAGDLSGAM